MPPPDAVLGWDDEATAQAYAAFTLQFPMYSATSRELAQRASLSRARTAVDLCGGVGTTAQAILSLMPADGRVISVDSAAAMQRLGRRALPDPRLSWITAPAEYLARYVRGPVDAVICNSAIWKTDIAAVFAAVHNVLRPGGRFVFNIGGGFAGIRHPDEAAARSSPTLNKLVHQVATRDYGYTPEPAASDDLLLPAEAVTEHLAAAGMSALAVETTAQHSTMAEKKAWMSIPIFARPPGNFTHAERMTILDRAYALTTPDAPIVTSWLVVVAERPRAIRGGRDQSID